MKNELAAKRLAELGHNTRLSIFRYLVKIGDSGAPVGQIQKKAGHTQLHPVSPHQPAGFGWIDPTSP